MILGLLFIFALKSVSLYVSFVCLFYTSLLYLFFDVCNLVSSSSLPFLIRLFSPSGWSLCWVLVQVSFVGLFYRSLLQIFSTPMYISLYVSCPGLLSPTVMSLYTSLLPLHLKGKLNLNMSCVYTYTLCLYTYELVTSFNICHKLILYL